MRSLRSVPDLADPRAGRRRRRPLSLVLAAGALGGALTLGAWSPVAWAASSASWASSEGASASVGSLSASVQSVSDSSTRSGRVAQGLYRVIALAPQPGGAGLWAMRLERVASRDTSPPADRDADAILQLVLPTRTVQAASIAAGDPIHVRELPQGFEFAHGEPPRAFFLALREEGLGELRTRALAL